MKPYKLKASVNNTPITNAYVFIDHDIATGEYEPQGTSQIYGFDNADSILKWFDDSIQSSCWRRAPQACYNGGASSYALNYLLILIEQHWGSNVDFNRLPVVYHQSEVLAQSAKINDTVHAVESVVNLSNNNINESTEIMSSSPFTYSIRSNGSNDTIFFEFNVLPEEAIQNGKLSLSTDMEYAQLNMRIYTGAGSNQWKLDTFVAFRANVPQSWVENYNNMDADGDPYSDDDGDSGPGGGGSDDQDAWDDDSDTTPEPPLPSLSATDTGFITLYNPRITELQNLASYMWSGLFDIDSFKKIMADPMDTIIGLSIVPVNVPSSGSQAVTVGNISTGVNMTKAASQYVRVDCGSIAISELRKSYLDYSPYTKISLMLPYIGSVDLSIDQLYKSSGGSLEVTYHVDILSGGCVAFVMHNGDVIGEYSGQCAVSVPLTGIDFTNTIMALGSLVASGAATIVSGGLSAPVSAAAIAGGITAAANSAINVASSKPTFQRAGNISGSNGLLSVQKPFVIIERPRLCSPARQNSFAGYPSYVTYQLSSLSGFTQMEYIKLDGIPMTDEERGELLALVRNGVIL